MRWQYGTTVEIMTGAGPAHVVLEQPEHRQPSNRQHDQSQQQPRQECGDLVQKFPCGLEQ